MANFDRAIGPTLKHEGGYVNDPDDPGGATNYGISLRFLKETEDLNGDGELDGDINNDGQININDIKQMTIDEARNLYKMYFWDRHEYDKIPNQDLAEQVFDMTVNAGARTAQRLLQRALHACGKHVAIDGYAGPETYGAAQDIDQSMLIAAYKSERAGYYRYIAAKNSDLEKFIKGWLRRAYGSQYNYEL